MTTLTVNIEDSKDLPVIEEILTRFGISYRVDETMGLNEEEERLYKRLKKSFKEIKDWEAGKVQLQDAREALKEIQAELDNEI